MGNVSKTLPSGAKLDISSAEFKVGWALFKAVSKELESVDIKIGAKASSLQDFFKVELYSDDTLNSIKNILTRLISSDEVERALWACMAKASYNGQRIQDPSVFEDDKARGDFLIVAKEVLWCNLSPFLRDLNSKFTNLLKTNSDTPKS